MAMPNTITRDFVNKSAGKVGSLTLTFPDGPVSFKITDATGKEYATDEARDATVAHLLHYASQSLQDAYSGCVQAAAKSGRTAKVEAVESFADKATKWLEGTVGVRGGGGIDAVTRLAMQQLAEFLTATEGEFTDADNEVREEYAALDEDKQKAYLLELAQGQLEDADFRKACEDEVETRRKEAEAKKARAAKIKVSLGGLKPKK